MTKDEPRAPKARSFNLRRRLRLSRGGAAAGQLRGVHVWLYESDVEFLGRRVGRRRMETVIIPEILHDAVNRLRRGETEWLDARLADYAASQEAPMNLWPHVVIREILHDFVNRLRREEAEYGLEPALGNLPGERARRLLHDQGGHSGFGQG